MKNRWLTQHSYLHMLIGFGWMNDGKLLHYALSACIKYKYSR